MEFFNIWELERVNIKISYPFLNEINQEIFLKFKTKKEAYRKIFPDKEVPWTTFKNILKYSYMKIFFVPLRIYLSIIENINLSRYDLQKGIVSYKTAGGINFVEKPILPIKITPVFHMLFAHHIGDGTVINPKKGRLPYFGYRQFDKFYRTNYIRKIEDIFGKIKFKKDYFENSTRPYCPPVISTLFFKYYNVSDKDFLSKSAKIPKMVFNKDSDSLLSILIAFIIDEGHIDSTQITIVLKNKSLIQDLYNICNVLDYESKVTYRNNVSYEDCGYLNILRSGMKKLYSDYVYLNKKYPVIDLGWKGDKIKDSLKIYNRKIYKREGNRDVLFDILKIEQLSVNQLASRLNMTRQGVRYHIHNLIKDKKIKLKDDTQNNWIYGV
ncbi:MAG: hypothetical protein KKA64_04450 [Nanoarchaeota archaeon]|nr:hypothetical protein [Nanoarchaeota archaeon]